MMLNNTTYVISVIFLNDSVCLQGKVYQLKLSWVAAYLKISGGWNISWMVGIKMCWVVGIKMSSVVGIKMS